MRSKRRGVYISTCLHYKAYILHWYLISDDSPFIEVIKCEDILHKKADVLPMFLNLNFEEVCVNDTPDFIGEIPLTW